MAATVGVKSILLQSANPHRLSLGHCPHKSCSIILVRSTFAKSAGFKISQKPWLLKTFISLNHFYKYKLRALPKKFSRKKLKYTYAGFVQHCLRIPKIYAACLSDVSPNGNNFLKLARGPLKSHIGALKFGGSSQLTVG